MRVENVTSLILGVVAVGLIAYDIWVAFFNRIPNERDTISGRLRDWGSSVAFLPFAWGVLGAHFWLTNETAWIAMPWAAVALVGAGACCTVGHFLARRFGFRFAGILPIVYIAAGMVLGVGLWPQ